jgi:transcription-repair coupling factor (superfamily II helicase)
MDGAPKSERLIVSGLPEGLAPRVLLRRDLAGDGPLIWVLRDDRRMAAARAALAFFAPELPVMTFPAWDCLPYDRISPNPAVSAARMATLATLAHRPPGRFVLLTTLNAATQRVPMPALLHSASFAARVGERIDEAGLRRFLATMGYAPTPTVTEPGDYAIRGGIVDIFPPGAAEPLRLDLFGDVLDGVRRFDPESQRSTARLDRIELAPVSEVILDDPAITRFRQNYRHAFGAGGAQDPLYEAVSAGRKQAGMEHWLPFFHDRLGTLFDHLPGAAVALDDRLEAALTARAEMIAEQYGARVEALRSPSDFDTVYKPCPPEALYLDADAFAAALAGRRVLETHVSPRASGPGVIDAGGRAGRNFAAERRRTIATCSPRLPITSATVRARARWWWPAIRTARAIGCRIFWPMRGWWAPPSAMRATCPRRAAGCFWRSGRWTGVRRAGADGDLRAGRAGRPADPPPAEDAPPGRELPDRGAALSPAIWSSMSITASGATAGSRPSTALGAPHECLALEYAGGDRLFLPVENIELLSRYGEGGCSTGWAAAPGRPQGKLKERIREIADKLIRVAAERGLRRRRRCSTRRAHVGGVRAPASPMRRPTTSSAIADVMEDLAAAGRWTGWSAAMSASARPRWRCARPSSPPWRGCRWR